MGTIVVLVLAVLHASQYSIVAMRKAEILQELPALTPTEREEVRQKLDELDAGAGVEWLDNCDLTEEERRLLEERLAAIEKNPDAGSSWEEVEARIRAKLGRRATG